MSFVGEGIKVGEFERLMSGVPLMNAERLDLKIALTSDGTIVIPSGLLGLFHQTICNGGPSWRDRLITLAKACIRAAHIATALANVEWRRVDTVERFQALADAAGVKLDDVNTGLIYNLLSNAQVGTEFVPSWTAERLSSCHLYDDFLREVTLRMNGRLADDLDDAGDFTQLALCVSLLTRWQTVQAHYSSQPGSNDMAQRASVLSRLSALLHIIRVSGRLARIAILHAILNSVPLEISVSRRFTPEAVAQINARVQSIMKLDAFKWSERAAAFFATASVEHLGSKVTAHRFPSGMWRALVSDQRLAPTGSAGLVNLAITPWGAGLTAHDINPNTQYEPQLTPIATPSVASWETMSAEIRDNVYITLMLELDGLEQDAELTYACRQASAVADAVHDLAPSSLHVSKYYPASNTGMVPIIVGGGVADAAIQSADDLTESALVPESAQTPDGSVFDTRDVARFMRVQAASLRERITLLAPGQQASYVILPGTVSAVCGFWPTVSVFALRELVPPAYLPGSGRPTFPLTLDGLAQANSVSVRRFQEGMATNLSAQATDGARYPIVFDLTRIGVVTRHSRPVAADDRQAVLNWLRTGQALENPALVGNPQQVWVPGYDRPYGIDVRQNLAEMLGDTFEAIDLTGVGDWLLWPYTRMPLPPDITRHGGGRAPRLAREQRDLLDQNDRRALPSEALFHHPVGSVRRIMASGEQQTVYLGNRGFTRWTGKVVALMQFWSFPAAIYPGDGIVLAVRDAVDAGRTRLMPVRLDVTDVAMWTNNDLDSITQEAILAGRRTGATGRIPESAYIAEISVINGAPQSL
jgi:hypothetical protein